MFGDIKSFMNEVRSFVAKEEGKLGTIAMLERMIKAQASQIDKLTNKLMARNFQELQVFTPGAELPGMRSIEEPDFDLAGTSFDPRNRED